MRDLGTLVRYSVQLGLDGGAFEVPFEGRTLKVVASYGDGWEHVSVSLPNRTPNWREMEHVKRLFFEDDEWAMQLHAPPSRHIWRPRAAPLPLPPEWMV